MKRAYRFVIDTLEEYTLGCADILFVNSQYTSSVVKDVFPRIHQFAPPIVLYPTLESAEVKGPVDASVAPTTDVTPVKEGPTSEENSPYPTTSNGEFELIGRMASADSPEQISSAMFPFIRAPLVQATYTQGYDFVFVSLNRYERKKRVEIAMEAFAHLKQILSQRVLISSSSSSSSSSLPLNSNGSIKLVPNTFLQHPAVAGMNDLNL